MSITANRHNEGASKWLITPVNIVNEDVSFTGVVNTKRRSLLRETGTYRGGRVGRALWLRGSHVSKVLDNLKISSILTCFESCKSITKAKLHNFKGPTRPVSKHRSLLKSYLLRVLRLSGPRLSSTEDGLILTV